MSGLLWAVIIVVGVVITVALYYVVWRVRQLSRKVAAHDKALRLSQTDGELNDGRRHLRAIPVVAAMATAGAWLRDHGAGRPILTAAVALVGMAAVMVAIWPHAPAQPGAVPPNPAPPATTSGPPSTPPTTTTTTSTPPAGPVRMRDARPATVRPRSSPPAPPTTVSSPAPTSPPTTTAPPKARPDDDGGDKKRRPGTCVWVWRDPVAEAQVCNG